MAEGYWLFNRARVAVPVLPRHWQRLSSESMSVLF